jgi:dipeptidyl aminopeptidase/acylaminoacyl peptidase
MTQNSRFSALASALAAAALLAACAAQQPAPEPMKPAPNAQRAPMKFPDTPATSADAGDIIKPNANLHTEGIPPIPAEIAKRVALYNEFRGHGFVTWHPTKREMIVVHRKQGQNTSQLFRVSAPMAEPEQLTEFKDPVASATYEPKAGNYIVFERDEGGSEQSQLYRMDLPSKQATLLSDPNERHDVAGWTNTTGQLLYTSVPLDKTAQGGRRAQVSTTLTLMDPAKPESRRKLAVLEGPGWYPGDFSWDDKTLSLVNYKSANESEIWLMNVDTGTRTKLFPLTDKPEKAVYFPGVFSKDNKRLTLVSDREGEFRELYMAEIATGKLTPITRHIPWDVSGGSGTEDGKLFSAVINADGRRELRLFDGNTLKELPKPQLPVGNVGGVSFHKKLPEMSFVLNSTKSPSEVWSFNPQTGKSERWTKSYAPAGIDTSTFQDEQIIRWKSFDGRMISGFMVMPPARFTGKRPVYISIHGGPEAQATSGFLGRANYLVNELGIALIAPNVRGSSGFGKTFLTLDDGYKREDSVKDIGALLDWIAQQPNLDASRVLVSGGSYGGYMSLATMTNYPERIAGGIDVVGISNFVTFLQATESYRRDLRRVEYGDERDPQMRAFQERISPLTNASKIKRPLFVVQGKNDPRVPVGEAEQIVAKVRANGTPVWYLRGENEGHGFARKENADFQFFATIRFIEQTLLNK